jgi:hypothetical protein
MVDKFIRKLWTRDILITVKKYASGEKKKLKI